MAFGDSLTRAVAPKGMHRAALFIDGANMFATMTNLKMFVDWNKVLHYYRNRFDLVRAYYYTAIPEGEASIRPLVDHLDYNGYAIRTKPTKEFVEEGTGRIKIKGNMDMDMALDAIDISPFVSDIILFTGDGDFRILVERLQQRGVRVHVFSTIRTNPPMIADELRRQADFFIDLADHLEEFRRHER